MGRLDWWREVQTDYRLRQELSQHCHIRCKSEACEDSNDAVQAPLGTPTDAHELWPN